MLPEVSFTVIDPARQGRDLEPIRALLAASGLGLDPDLEVFVTAWAGRSLAGCAGLAGDRVKCVAIAPAWRGEALTLKLMTEVLHTALERGHPGLLLYTRPANVPLFQGCGFRKLVEVPDQAAFMENHPVGLAGLCERLRTARHPGRTIGSVVLNANPFTLGHRHLALTARAACDWLHVFVVGEDASTLAYPDRLALVQAGLADLDRITVHPGNRYLVSKATFPGYFLKDAGLVEACGAATDLLVFRQHLAPALGITHRFVGTEPFCGLTRHYNEAMHRWLETHPCGQAPVRVVEVPRLAVAGRPVSASEVRRLLGAADLDAIAPLVPATTLALLRDTYCPSAGCGASTASRSQGG
jgi:[citrate (pro-3S)-lyase] ligase